MWWILLILLLAAPVRIQADIRWTEALTVELLTRIWGLPLRRKLQILPTGKGHRMLMQTENHQPHEPAADKLRRGMAALGTLLRTDRARRSLLRAIRLDRLDAQITVGLSDAAATALLTGLAAGLVRLLPPGMRKKTRIRLQPDFLQGKTSVLARCIIFFHLGSLLPAAAMALAAALSEAREHHIMPMTEEV